MQFSPDQLKIVTHQSGSLLASAAAGSGKTTTMVAHVMQRLEREELDRMVILTYTRAAAGEMRQRIMDELSRKLEQDPGNHHLRRQLFAAPLASIGTIDSFCLNLVQEHFDKLDLNPDLRLADEKELQLLEDEILEQLLEEAYREGGEAFFNLRNNYGDEKNHDRIKHMVSELYRVSRNDPDPAGWLEKCLPAYPTDGDGWLASPMMQQIFQQKREQVCRLKRQAERLRDSMDIASSPKLREMFQRDLQEFDIILQAQDAEELFSRIRQAAFPNKAGESPEDKKALDLFRGIKSGSRGYIGGVMELARHYRGAEEELRLLQLTAEPVGELIRLAGLLGDRLAAACREKNITDFAGLEHFALQLLMQREADGSFQPTELARELQSRYREVIVDEYQDVNQIQEYILQALAGPNLFMVGDVKQSIYRFRRAKPSIFVNKYLDYQDDEHSLTKRVDLKENYRSRPEILTGANELFRAIMTPESGGVAYDHKAALHPAAAYQGEGVLPRAILIETPANAWDGAVEQARYIAGEIRRLFRDNLQVFDTKKQSFRDLALKDIVILLRTRKRAKLMAEVLQRFGIPAVYPHKSGFFERAEVKTMLALLKLVDNPRQDIPLAAVLLSPIGGFTQEELATLQDDSQQAGLELWDRMQSHRGAENVQQFLARLEAWRIRGAYEALPELIRDLFQDSGYETYLKSHPGEGHEANIRELMTMAGSFERGNGRGLYRFLRYVERQKKLGVEDRGEAERLDAGTDAVHIDSMHSSKGLEFPVVFLALAEAPFSTQDSEGDFFTEEEEGIALKSVDSSCYVKTGNMCYDSIMRKIRMENLSEEIRLLYVGMTRARERLYLVGRLKDVEKEMEKLRQPLPPGDTLPLELIQAQKSNLMLYLAAQANGLLSHFPMETIPAQDLPREEDYAEIPLQTAVGVTEAAQKKLFWAMGEEGGHDSHEPALPTLHKMAYSVTELKQIAKEREAGDYQDVPWEAEAFTEESSRLNGADRGTAYHKLMEHLPWRPLPDEAAIRTFGQEMVEKGLLTREEWASIDPADIGAFFTETVGRRAAAAAGQGKLWREKPFMFGLPLEEILPESRSTELILVQGIIDLFFEEDGKLILVDYKSDRSGTEADFIRRHGSQLRHYARGLGQATGMRVEEIYIYAFRHRRFIPLPGEWEKLDKSGLLW